MMNRVKRTAWCLPVMFLLGACAAPTLPYGVSKEWLYPHSNYRTLSEDSEDHNQRVARILDLDRRALAEDLDLLFMTDRGTRLTRWHDR